MQGGRRCPATNGSATTEIATNLFDPAQLSVTDIADVLALSLLPATDGTQEDDNILLLSQESGVILEVNRSSGAIESTLVLQKDSDNPLSVVDQGHEGITMDRDGFLYVVSEQGGGRTPCNCGCLSWRPLKTPRRPGWRWPMPFRRWRKIVTDNGIGTNSFSASGADAAFFEADAIVTLSDLDFAV